MAYGNMLAWSGQESRRNSGFVQLHSLIATETKKINMAKILGLCKIEKVF